MISETRRSQIDIREFLHRYLTTTWRRGRKALNDPMQQARLRSKDENASMKIPAPQRPRRERGLKQEPEAIHRRNDGPEEATESRKPSHVTSVRHWSTPEYTRIAIGLEKDVKFEAQRIENPERIFFDLLNTNLTSSLLGKTFDVDDGLLTKDRVAQFQPGKSRIVLEVADGSDYRTSVLTDPPRLIIDIRGKDIQRKNAVREPP